MKEITLVSLNEKNYEISLKNTDEDNKDSKVSNYFCCSIFDYFKIANYYQLEKVKNNIEKKEVRDINELYKEENLISNNEAINYTDDNILQFFENGLEQIDSKVKEEFINEVNEKNSIKYLKEVDNDYKIDKLEIKADNKIQIRENNDNNLEVKKENYDLGVKRRLSNLEAFRHKLSKKDIRENKDNKKDIIDNNKNINYNKDINDKIDNKDKIESNNIKGFLLILKDLYDNKFNNESRLIEVNLINN